MSVRVIGGIRCVGIFVGISSLLAMSNLSKNNLLGLLFEFCHRLRSNNFSSAAFGRKARRPSLSPEWILIDRTKYQKKMLNLNLLLHEEHFIARKLPPTSFKRSPLTSLLSKLYTTNCILKGVFL